MLHDERSREEVRRLEDDFFDWFEAADAEELEDGTLDGFLEELERVDPMPGDFDPKKSLADFHEKYAALLEPQKEEKRRNHRSRRAFFAVAAVAAVLASMVTAQALGVDIFGFFGRWTDDIFTLTSSADKAGYQERFYPMEEGESIKYSSLEEALRAFQIDLPLVPKWFPERFGELEVTGSVMPYGMWVFASSEGQENFLSIEYSEFGEDGPPLVIEKDKDDPILYESGGMIYHIVTDNGHCKAAWTIDNIQCVITGPLTVEEMERIIDSIYSDEAKKAEFPPPSSFASSLKAALDECGISGDLAPTWCPEGFEASEPEIISKKSVDIISVGFHDAEERFFTIRIAQYRSSEDLEALVFEKDKTPVEQYTSGGKTFYIFSNIDTITAVWTDGLVSETIMGNLTVEEVKKIIDSIYSDGEKEAEFPPPSSFASSLKAALDECGISGEFVPTWCPEGFEASEPVISNTSRTDKVYIMFRDGEERFFAIRIAQYRSSEDLEALVFEKDKTPVEQYTSGGKTFYIFSNIDTITAVWADGLVRETIMGNLTVEEVKKIIDSIDSNEVKKAESPPPSSFASSLKAALDECGISGEFVPTWCPEGFEASEPVISRTKRYDTINLTFQNDKERFFGIMIICYQSMEDVELFTFEKDKTPVEQYTSGEKTFYIFSNDDTITAVWADGLIHESIAGNLTVEEVKAVIDSIGNAN